jgi:hypothetical protein
MFSTKSRNLLRATWSKHGMNGHSGIPFDDKLVILARVVLLVIAERLVIEPTQVVYFTECILAKQR